MGKEIMVSVLCTAYNHERYIEECLNSLVKQNVNFNYEILVHDDASTDNTAKIVHDYELRYPEKIKAIYQKENQYSQGIKITSILLPIAKGKYIALCEGDDFWTDVYKLQKQFDFMEKNQKYSVCGHAAYLAGEDGAINIKKLFKAYDYNCEISIEDILSDWCLPTNSLFYRKEARGVSDIPYQENCANEDYATIVYLALAGKVHYCNEIMSAYRVVSRGSLNWSWRQDSKKMFESRKEFVAMLDRIDEYTKRKYHHILVKYKENVLFNLYLGMGKISECKAYKEKYESLNIKERLKLYIRHYAPFVVKMVRKIRG